jgi:glycosyltransferase involved in cell wall biosynthesis
MDGNPDLVSVIIPTFNAQDTIGETIRSVLDQEYEQIELIIVDDGSEDQTRDILSNLKIGFYRQENKGACAARNLGITKSEGSYIQFLDGDDLLAPNKIASQMEALRSDTNAIANGRWGRFYTDDPWTENIAWGPDKSLQRDLDAASWLCQNHMSQTACWLTPRHLIEKAGTWDQSLTQNQDGEFFTRVLKHAEKVIYTVEAKVYYRSNQSDTVSKNARKLENIRSRYKACESFEQVLLSMENSERTRKAIANKYQHFVFGAYPNGKEYVQRAEKKIQIYGGSNWKPRNIGKVAAWSHQLIGWKNTARVKQWLGR